MRKTILLLVGLELLLCSCMKPPKTKIYQCPQISVTQEEIWCIDEDEYQIEETAILIMAQNINKRYLVLTFEF